MSAVESTATDEHTQPYTQRIRMSYGTSTCREAVEYARSRGDL